MEKKRMKRIVGFQEGIKANQGNPIVEDLEKFLAWHQMRNNSAYTIRNFRTVANSFIKYLAENHPDAVANNNLVSTGIVRQYVQNLQNEKGFKPQTVNFHIKGLQNFYNYCRRTKLIVRNPFQHKAIPLMKIDKEVKHAITIEEKRKIVSLLDLTVYADIQTYCMVETLWASGMRLGELANLQVQDIDFPNRKIHIRKTKGRQERIISLNDSLAGILESLLIVRKGIPTESNKLFINANGKPYHKNSIGTKVTDAGKHAGFGNCNPHSYRRSFAQRLINQAGLDLFTVCKIMGWTDINQCKAYLTLDDKTMQDSMNKI